MTLITIFSVVGYGYLMVFLFSIPLGLYRMQDPSYLGKVYPSINVV